MDVVSLAWQTDLALLAAGGSEVEHHPTYVVVRTPASPARRWGNFLLLRRRPLNRDLETVRAVFRRHFPDASHEAYGIDDPEGGADDLHLFRSAGFTTGCSVTLTTEEPLAEGHRRAQAEVRPLESDDDWEQRIRLSLAGDLHPDPVYLDFLRSRARADRCQTTLGGRWFGAFEDDHLVGALGVLPAGPGLVRCQEIPPPRRMRGRGVEQALMHVAAAYAQRELGTRRLVIVAEPDYPQLEVYRALGFRDAGLQLQAERHAA